MQLAFFHQKTGKAPTIDLIALNVRIIEVPPGKIPSHVLATSPHVSPDSYFIYDELANASSLIFHGDLDLKVGPLVENDRMKTFLATSPHASIPTADIRYNPSNGVPSSSTGNNAVIYVLGKVRKYTGPNQQDRSKHIAQIIDVDLQPTSDQKRAYKAALDAWLEHSSSSLLASTSNATLTRDYAFATPSDTKSLPFHLNPKALQVEAREVIKEAEPIVKTGVKESGPILRDILKDSVQILGKIL